MSRAKRMLDLSELLRASEATTVDAIAHELGVSRRTVFRDIAALRDRGWPIVSDPGPGGGVRLERQRGVASVHLGTQEAVTLWVACQLSISAGQLPWSASAQSALNKILSSLPAPRAKELRQLVKRVVVGRPASPRVVEQLGQPPRELLAAFERGFSRAQCLRFDYTDRHKRTTRRTIEPHGLLVEPPAWYILARDVDRQVARVFRMDRIARPRLLTRTFTPAFDQVKAEAFAPR